MMRKGKDKSEVHKQPSQNGRIGKMSEGAPREPTTDTPAK